MALSQEATALITKLEEVHARATTGDREVIHFVKSLKTRALSGDVRARRIYNTLAVIHWQKVKGGDYARVEAYYQRLKQKEPRAMAKLQLLLQRVRSGDPEARQLFSAIKSVHHKWKSSAFTDGPGAPRIGGYGLPEQHRAGIIIGGNEPLTYPSRPSYSNQGHGGGYPMSYPPRNLHGRRPVNLHQRHGYGPPRISGIGGVAVQPLTPSALANLISLMARVRIMPLANLNVPVQALQGAFSTVAPPSGISTVSTPTGIRVNQAAVRAVPVVEPAICARARDAVARKSPTAPALIAACAQLGFHIPYNPADFPTVAPAPGAPTALGRITLVRR